MHRSRLAGFIIDCKEADPESAATFWSAALGMPKTGVDAGPGYVELRAGARDLHIEVQRVAHDSRVHLDIETDDKEAEAKRLEALGARRVVTMPRWIVLEAPTGQRFCVVNAHQLLEGAAGTTAWP